MLLPHTILFTVLIFLRHLLDLHIIFKVIDLIIISHVQILQIIGNSFVTFRLYTLLLPLLIILVERFQFGLESSSLLLFSEKRECNVVERESV